MRAFTTNNQSGFTLAELLVSLSMFGVISLSMVSFSSSALRTMAIENKASIAAKELKNGLGLMSTELRMSSLLSPYLVGNSASVVTCSSSLSVVGNKVMFLVVQDDGGASTSGIQPYYVGYWYNSTNKQLLRGEIERTSITDCTLSGEDPTDLSNAEVLAEDVVQIDTNGDGTLDQAFSTNGNSIVVNLGIQVDSANGLSITQPMPLSIHRRIS